MTGSEYSPVMAGVIEIDECDLTTVPAEIGEGQTTVRLVNSCGRAGDVDALMRGVSSVRHIRRVSELRVTRSSRLADLRVLRTLPSVKTVRVYGGCIQTLAGLEVHPSYSYVEISTEKNTARSIGQIVEPEIAGLEVTRPSRDDLAAIGVARANVLYLAKCSESPFEFLRGPPLRDVKLSRCTMDTISGIGVARPVSSLRIGLCQRLRRFSGRNSVPVLYIEACSGLDWTTLSLFDRVENLSVVGIRSRLPLGHLLSVQGLRYLKVSKCDLVVDALESARIAPSLQGLTLIGVKRDQVMAISAANPLLSVSDGTWEYVGGHKRVEGQKTT